MLSNFIKIALRNLWRFKVYSLINIAGLALGLTVGILIMLFVVDELSFDKFHEKGDRIFKVVTGNNEGGGMEANSWPVANILASEYPEVEEAVYIRRTPVSMLVNDSEQKRHEHDMFFAGNEFFRIFTFQFIEGAGENALKSPGSVVLTRNMRERYFPDGNALGKVLTIADSMEFEVTGVIENIPAQSHMQFDALVSFSTYERLNPDFSYTEGWGNFNVRNYILLREDANQEAFAEKVSGLYMDRAGEAFRRLGVELSVKLEPLADVYLRSAFANGMGPQGSIDRIYLISAIAIFVLLLAIINYVNLSTARSVFRAREVGMRKIVGSSRRAIFWQFQIEVFIITLISFILVVLFLDLLIPYFNSLMDKQYSVDYLLTPGMLVGVGILLLSIAFLSGFYPSIILSSFRPSEVLKAKMGGSRRGVNLRRSLVIIQFSVSGALVMATLIVINQLQYMQKTDLGFDKERVVVFDVTRVPGSLGYSNFAEKLRRLSGVERVTLSNAMPGRPGWLGQWAYAKDQGENADQVDTEYMAVDDAYLETLGLTLIAGRNFNPQRQSDLDNGLIINETTVKSMGWVTPENAIGKHIVSPSGTPAGEVIGVVKDYHDLGLQEEIWPQAMDFNTDYTRYVAVKIMGSTKDIMDQSRELWNDVFGDFTYEYFFLDEEFDKQYRSEERLMEVFILFAILTVIIASIGLLGLVSFMVVSRTKEIGIRKVLGADTRGLIALLSREFIVLVFLANIVIIPFVWYAGSSWLSEFAYHTSVNPLIFTFSLIIMVALTFVVVASQTLGAARLDPVDTLRNE